MKDRYIPMLVGIFFLGVAADWCVTTIADHILIRAVVMVLVVAIPLCLLLRARLAAIGLSPAWAWFGLFPGIGFPLALFLYFYDPWAEPEAGQ